ncbi:pectate lyase-like adhesive domain-containing protein, partial [Carnobacterium maltaromaticum]|uniref:pectate lyase-like adhesive domain-containing protein n=1 Tax=Carnobacterium maltaromaticum TaxID=2751 RepID=UPI00295E555D
MKNTRNKKFFLFAILFLLIGCGLFSREQFLTSGISASEAIAIKVSKDVVFVNEKFDVIIREQGLSQAKKEVIDSSELVPENQISEEMQNQQGSITKLHLPEGLEFDAERTKQLNEQTDKFTTTWDSDARTIEIKWLEYQTKNELILALEAKTSGTYELEAIRQFNDEKEISEKLMIQVKDLLQNSTAPVAEESIVNKSTESLIQPTITRQTRAVGVDEPPVASEGTVANVTNQATFIAAMKDTNVTQINLMNDILITSGLANQYPGDTLGPAMRNNKTLVIEGNPDGSRDRRLDFQGLSMHFKIIVANQSMDLVMRNLKLNGTNYFGPFSNMTPNSYQKNFNMYYHNVDYEGSQLVDSGSTNIYFSGNVKVDSVPDYLSLSGTILKTQTNDVLYKPDGTTAAVTNQQNMIAGNINFMENTHFWGRTTGSANIHVVGGATPYEWGLFVGKNVVIDLEVGGPSQWGESGNINNGWPSIYLENNTKFLIQNGAKVNIKANKTTGIQSTGRGGIGMNGTASVNVGSGAELNVDIDKTIYSAYKTVNSYYGDAIRMGTDSSVLVQSGGEINLAMSNVDTKQSNADYLSMINMKRNGIFKIENGGTLTLKKNQTTSTDPFNGVNVQGTGSSIVIGQGATLDAELDGAGISNVINIALGSTFNFSDAESVDLRLTNMNTASRLISMNGTLNINIPNVMAWNRGQDILNETAARQWNPMYGIKTVYSGGNVTSTTGNSITSTVTTDFRTNFRTQNFTRLKFAFNPDVDLVINRPLTDNKTNTSSHVITGIAYPGAFIRLSLVDASGNPVANQSLLPTATIPSQIESEQGNVANNFHTNADSEGNWSVSLPAGSYLEADMRIKGYGFLNGKDASDTALVLDRTAPDAPVLNPIKDQDATITGTAEVGSTVRAYSVVGDIQLGSDVIADSTGKYTITIPADKRPLVPYLEYYTTSSDHATDEEGNATPNTSAKSNLQAVVDT